MAEERVIVSIEAMPAGVERLCSAADRRGCHLVLLAKAPAMYESANGGDVREFDTSSSLALKRYLADIDGLAGVFSSTNTWGPMAARLAEELGLPTQSSRMLERLADKHWVRSRLFRVGLDPSPPRFLDQDLSGAIPFPVIVKPSVGTGSRDVIKVSDHSELEGLRSRLRERAHRFVVEPYLEGPVYSAEFYTYGERTVVLGITNRTISPEPEFVELVKSFPHLSGTEWEESTARWVREVVSAVDYRHGFGHLEFVDTVDGPRIVELNARLGGALIGPAIIESLGFDPYDRLINDALGGASLPVPPVTPAGGFSHVSLYAQRPGRLAGVVGLDRLDSLPGEIRWWPSARPGDEFTSIGDYRARLGHVSATGFCSAQAQDRAEAAARLLRFEFEEAGGQRIPEREQA